MEYVIIAMKIIVAASLINVWLLRFGKATQWRGGNAGNMKEEFAVYGLPSWFMYIIGTLKVGLSVLLLASIWYPEIERVAAFGITALMAGAVLMHVKAGDPINKSFPAFSFLVLSALIGIL